MRSEAAQDPGQRVSLQLTRNAPWPETGWRRERFFDDNDHFFDAFFEAVDNAHHSILLATYIFELDALGRKLIRALRRARARGLDVRVVYDGVGSLEAAATLATRLESAGIPVRIYHPLPWQPANYRRALRRTSWLGSVFLSLLKINQRQHAKVCVIDRYQLWAGSQNICNDHLSPARGGLGWHDFGAAVEGAGVAGVADSFEDFWHYRRPRLGRGLFRYYWNNLGPRERRRKNRLLATRIGRAERRVWVINPYFSPPRAIIRALLRARAHGADVRLIVPNKSDLDFFPLLTATYYQELIANGVRIFEYLPAILHGKLLLADDFLLLGSTNLNHRSLLHDLEFDLVLEKPEVRHRAETAFQRDQAHSREIDQRQLRLLGWRRLLGWLPWLLRYWL